MPRPPAGPATRRILVASVGAGLLATSLMGGTATAAQATPTGESALSALAAPLKEGRYIVVLADEPAATYDGGVSGLRATKVSPGEQLDPVQPEVEAYTEHLEAVQDNVAASVGATPIYMYTLALNGFAAELSAEAATALARTSGVMAVVPDEKRSLDTVYSPEFLGLKGSGGTWQAVGGVSRAGRGTVVGVIDSGITPENRSFAGRAVTRRSNGGQVAIPYRSADGDIAMLKADGDTFEGTCETGESFAASLCNSKLISARSFSAGFEANVPEEDWGEFETRSPRDGDGHGTHTAGTAAGNNGVRMNVDGTSFGAGSGMAPAAKIATYKVCWEAAIGARTGCYTSDSVAAVNQAIGDGVDVLNYSISGSLDSIYDPVERAFLSAASAGIFVAASAGNTGPGASTVAHNSPWTMTVAASTHHNYLGTVVLGNGQKLLGASSSSTGLPGQTPTVLSEEAGVPGAVPADLALCGPDTLDPVVVTGTVVVCDRGVFDRVAKSAEVSRAGGVGMILVNVTPGSLDADVHAVPTVHMSDVDRTAVRAYVAGNADATSALLPRNSSGKPAPALPAIAAFSGRGPALANGGDLLKPDISAPGVNVLAAVAPLPNQGRDYNFLSGTSMSSPHIAGLGAIILGEHPDWSPAVLKSAMMTTAYDLKKEDGSTDADLFNSASGHVDPTRFLNPALVYDATYTDYVAFLEGTGVDTRTGIAAIDPSNLNYPSIAVGEAVGPQTVTRTLTALTPGLYVASVDMPGFDVEVVPSVLSFDAAGETRDVRIEITRSSAPPEEYGFGHLTWSGGGTTVRSAIAVRPVAIVAPEELTGSGTSGSVEYTVTPGVDGEVDLAVSGQVAGDSNSGSGVPGERSGTPDDSNGVYPFTVPTGTTVARLDLVADDPASDLDLYVVTPSGDLLTSATGDASERLTLDDPEPGGYLVVVNVFSTPGGATTTWTMNNFAVPGTAAGNLTVSPDPLPATAGQEATVTAAWSGLEAGAPYLGFVTYEGAPSRTFITVS